jgi:hypothetical protein
MMVRTVEVVPKTDRDGWELSLEKTSKASKLEQIHAEVGLVDSVEVETPTMTVAVEEASLVVGVHLRLVVALVAAITQDIQILDCLTHLSGQI